MMNAHLELVSQSEDLLTQEKCDQKIFLLDPVRLRIFFISANKKHSKTTKFCSKLSMELLLITPRYQCIRKTFE